MKPFSQILTLMLVAVMVMGSAPRVQAASFEVSGWIPYWRTDAGTREARDNIEKLTEVNPFGYTVRQDGTLYDAANIENSAWLRLFSDARKEDVWVIPTVMWSDTNAIHSVLANNESRMRHIKSIAQAVEKGGFDGVDIDYEGKKAETRLYYALFLLQLKMELGDKKLHCTIEPRMPLSARYVGAIPDGIEYANELPIIGYVCDQVRIMTYDQQTADVELNATARAAGEIYAPIADTEWAEKVIRYMAKEIPMEKMSLGIATYGHIYQMMPRADGSGFDYTRLEAFNPTWATDLADKLSITPERGRSGELSFSYIPEDHPRSLPSGRELERLAPRNTPSAQKVAAGALALAKKEGRQAPFEYLTWSDADAIEQKVELAKRLGMAGVSLFKIDGGADQKMWRTLR